MGQGRHRGLLARVSGGMPLATSFICKTHRNVQWMVTRTCVPLYEVKAWWVLRSVPLSRQLWHVCCCCLALPYGGGVAQGDASSAIFWV